MEIITIFIIAVGLAMDAFAVSVAAGTADKKLHIKYALRMAVFFGVFQGVMPLIGFFAGESFKGRIQACDHWIAFGLLVLVGGKMIYESLKLEETENVSDPSKLLVVFLLAIATSIDALAVGITLSMVTEGIMAAAVIIGVVTFVMSLAGTQIGIKIGHVCENQIEMVGGIILILIGLKILIEHLVVGK